MRVMCFTMAVVIICCLGAVPSQARIQETDVVGVWLFDGDQDELEPDLSGNGHDADIVAGAGEAKRVDGKYDGGLYVEAGGHAAVAHADDLNLVEFTMAAWVKVPGVLNPYQFVMGKEGWPDRNYSMWILPGVMTFGFTTPGAAQDIQIGSAEIANDQWHHVAGTYDGEQLVSYVDGVRKQQRAANAKPATTTAPLKIGVQPPGTGGPLTGTVDEVALFRRALEEDEILQALEGLNLIFYDVAPAGKAALMWANLKQQD